MAALHVVTTRFADWLDTELQRRDLSRTQLAAFIGKRPQTVYSWFNEDRIPTPPLCIDIARVLKVSPLVVLREAGHLPEDIEIEEPAIPPWLAELLEPLTEAELRVLAETARGLLRLREERAANEVGREPPAEQS